METRYPDPSTIRTRSNVSVLPLPFLVTSSIYMFEYLTLSPLAETSSRRSTPIGRPTFSFSRKVSLAATYLPALPLLHRNTEKHGHAQHLSSHLAIFEPTAHQRHCVRPNISEIGAGGGRGDHAHVRCVMYACGSTD